MLAERRSPRKLPKILGWLSLALMAAVILFNLGNLLDKALVLVGIPYAGVDYRQRQNDVLGVTTEGLQWVSDNIETDKTTAWVSQDYVGRQPNVYYWLYPRKIWLGSELQQAASQSIDIILVLNSCDSPGCLAAGTGVAPDFTGYGLLRQFRHGNEMLSVLSRVN